MRFLGLALRLELVQVSEHGVELLARRGEVLLVVEERRLLGLHARLLALHLLGVGGLRDGVLLRELVVTGLRLLLRRLRFSEQRCEVRLRNLGTQTPLYPTWRTDADSWQREESASRQDASLHATTQYKTNPS